MNKNISTETPGDDWTLNQLGEFAQKIAKRTAHDAWLLGRAFAIAKAKAKAEGLKIEKWRKEWLPVFSQPTLSRYEAVATLTEDEVVGKRLAEVYRLLGLTPQKAEPAKPSRPLTEPVLGATRNTATSGASHAATSLASAERHPLANGLKVIPAEPEGEPDSVLKRLASVVALLNSLVNDLPSLDMRDDPTAAINDAVNLLEQLRAAINEKEAA